MPVIDVHGVGLYYELHGPADAPVIVLNNGILMNAASSWLPQRGALSDACRLLLYDCRGQGLSAHPPGPYSMEQHADDLAGLLVALEIPAAHIAGISYGGEVAQAFALRHPPATRSLFLADTVSEAGPELRLVIEGWREAARLGDPELFYLVTVPWNFSPGFIASHAELLDAARARYRDLDFPAVVRLCEAFLSSVDFTSRLPAVTVPARIVVGELDLLKGPAYADVLHRSIAGSDLHVIPGAGHATCWEQPAEFNRLLLEFVRGVETRSLRPTTVGGGQKTE
ncbi:MAG: alpha/beta fold hydrolase [Acidobacteriota bacterium]